jgi:diguanylate cyclase (GGDEF)-like protein
VPANTTRASGVPRASGRSSDSAALASRLRILQRACLSTLNRRDTLLDLVQAVQATLEPEQIAQAVIERTAVWIPLTCWCVVAQDVREQLFVLADTGLVPDLGPGLYGAAGWVIRHDQTFVSGNVGTDDRLTVPQDAAVVAVPLRGREQVVGALVGIDRGVSKAAPVLTRSLDQALADLLSPVGYALDTALLLKRAEALSVTDDLTRLYNARYLNTALRRETRLATRNSRPLSLLFIDLDGFKSINDSHGHLAGSRALVEAGAVIRGSARETDIVARFGGDEFALILPDTGSPGALQVAERICERIARHRFLAEDGLDIHLTASVGVATLPDVAVAADELVQAADAAMYRVKDRGKNGIQAAASSR